MPFYDNVYYPYPSDPPGTHSSAGIPSLLSSPQSQPSSGSQSRPAVSIMSGPLTSSGASTSIQTPFKFRSRHESVDWRRMSAVDVDRVACEMDFQALQEHITAVTFCNVEGERCHRCQNPVDQALLKLFRLAQLTVEYLLHSQDCLSISLQAAEERLLAEAREKEELCVQLQKKTQDAKALKEELKQRKKIITSQQAMFSAGISANYHKCHHCDKAFMNSSFLQSHMQRRHPAEFDIKLNTENQKKVQILKLQDEINKLQQQLSLVTVQMEMQQKDYTAKQEKELIQKQEEFKRQLEIWKEDEKRLMNSKMDEVKQACQRDMDSMHQKNRNLETELLKLHQKNQQESVQPAQTQQASVSKEHWQEVVKLQQKLHKQEVKWSGKMQKMREDHDTEKILLQKELSTLHSTVTEGREESRRQVQELSHRLQEQQQIITSQNNQMKQISSKQPTIAVPREVVSSPAPESKTKVVVSEQSSSVHKLDPIVELSEEDKDSSSISESPQENRSWQKEVQELLKNPGLRRDMRLAAQQNMEDRLQSFGVELGVSCVSKALYKSSMSQVIAERKKRQNEDSLFRRVQKENSHTLEQRVKERSREQPAKPKQQEQVTQSRPRSSSFPSTVTRVVSHAALKQAKTPQPVPRSRISTLPKTSTPLQHHRSPFSSDEDSSEEEESSEEEPPPTQTRKAVLVNSTPVKPQTTKTQTASNPRAPVRSTNRTDVKDLSESDSDWTEGSEMEEIHVSQLDKHADQNGNLPKIAHSNVKALGKSLEKQLETRTGKKPAGGVNTFLGKLTSESGIMPMEKPTAVKKIKQDPKKELKFTDEDEDDDDWDISSLEDVPTGAKPSQHSVPVRKSLDKSQDTSTSVWGSSTGQGHKPGLTDAGTGSTLKSSLVSVSDWDDSDEM